jgi:hypothetical protein
LDKEKQNKTNDSQDPKEITQIPQKPSIVSWAVFIPTLIVVCISLITVIFPALIARSTSPLGTIFKPDVINPFETGALAWPLVIVNLVLLGIGILYFKKKHLGLTRLIRTLHNFDLSKKRALIILTIILVIYIGARAGELTTQENWDDYKAVKDRASGWTISEVTKSFDVHVRYFLLSTSLKIFGNIRVIPFVASIALLVLTYYTTSEISQNRFAGIISMLVLIQSNVFLSYDTTSTYDNFWILFYLFSLYLIYKKWQPSPFLYLLSIFSKPLTIAFLPMTLFFIARSDIPRKTKLFSLGSYGAIIILLIAAVLALHVNLTGSSVGFDGNSFLNGFTSLAIQIRFDGLVLIFLLPLIVMLFLASRKGIIHADSIMVLILGILLVAPFLIGFTSQTNQPYRFVSLVVFFAIGVGILLSKRVKVQA